MIQYLKSVWRISPRKSLTKWVSYYYFLLFTFKLIQSSLKQMENLISLGFVSGACCNSVILTSSFSFITDGNGTGKDYV